VEYELTEFGKTLCPAMKTLVDWAMTFPKTRETQNATLPAQRHKPYPPASSKMMKLPSLRGSQIVQRL
jgi:hypothetical protein